MYAVWISAERSVGRDPGEVPSVVCCPIQLSWDRPLPLEGQMADLRRQVQSMVDCTALTEVTGKEVQKAAVRMKPGKIM